jgi:hypothetical protein
MKTAEKEQARWQKRVCFLFFSGLSFPLSGDGLSLLGGGRLSHTRWPAKSGGEEQTTLLDASPSPTTN